MALAVAHNGTQPRIRSCLRVGSIGVERFGTVGGRRIEVNTAVGTQHQPLSGGTQDGINPDAGHRRGLREPAAADIQQVKPLVGTEQQAVSREKFHGLNDVSAFEKLRTGHSVQRMIREPVETGQFAAGCDPEESERITRQRRDVVVRKRLAVTGTAVIRNACSEEHLRTGEREKYDRENSFHRRTAVVYCKFIFIFRIIARSAPKNRIGAADLRSDLLSAIKQCFKGGECMIFKQ